MERMVCMLRNLLGVLIIGASSFCIGFYSGSYKADSIAEQGENGSIIVHLCDREGTVVGQSIAVGNDPAHQDLGVECLRVGVDGKIIVR